MSILSAISGVIDGAIWAGTIACIVSAILLASGRKMRLTERDDGKEASQLAADLRLSGIDPDALKRRFHEKAKAIASRERAAGRPAPLALQQAIEQTAPDDVMSSEGAGDVA